MVSIDNVYKSVLTILNKENRGYVTPREFNDYARQAQLEIFESYFSKANFSAANDSDYSDTKKNVEEKISYFENEDALTSGTFSNSAGQSTSDYYAFPTNFYRLNYVSSDSVLVEEISSKQFLFVNRSPLTKPTVKNPVYFTHESGVVIKPTGVTDINIGYVRKPNDPKWVGGALNGQILVNTSGTGFNNFELHPSEEPELVAKILSYIGVTLRAQDVLQAAAAKDQQINQTEQ